VATGCALHLIEPLGFDVSEKACRRAGLDYWARLDVRRHPTWAAYESCERPSRVWLLTTKASRMVFDAEFCAGDHLVFGKETAGLPRDLVEARPNSCLALPMAAGERSLNVATAVCAVVYEGVRQLLTRGEVVLDIEGRLRR